MLQVLNLTERVLINLGALFSPVVYQLIKQPFCLQCKNDQLTTHYINVAYPNLGVVKIINIVSVITSDNYFLDGALSIITRAVRTTMHTIERFGEQSELPKYLKTKGRLLSKTVKVTIQLCNNLTTLLYVEYAEE